MTSIIYIELTNINAWDSSFLNVIFCTGNSLYTCTSNSINKAFLLLTDVQKLFEFLIKSQRAHGGTVADFLKGARGTYCGRGFQKWNYRCRKREKRKNQGRGERGGRRERKNTRDETRNVWRGMCSASSLDISYRPEPPSVSR